MTGAAGYIGSRLVHRLVRDGYAVRALDRASAPNLPRDVQFIQADLLDPDAYVDALRGCRAIFHLAAAKGDWGITDEEYARDNVDATAALIGAAKDAGVDHWLFYSTVSVLGPSDKPLPEETPHAPANAYGATKAQCEVLFDELIERRPETRVLTIRPSVVFGPENPWNTNIYRLIDAVTRRRFVMIGDGHQIKTTSFIDNLIDATMHLYDRWRNGPMEPPQDIYHCIDEPVISVGQLVAHIHQQLGAKASPKLPLWLAAPLASVGDVTAKLTGIDLPITGARVRKFCTPTLFSAAKLASTGFKPRVSIEQGVDQTIAWHREMLEKKAS
ncbi:NAD-dependent epimerase/dehydratase family protein [Sphingomonas sp. M1-B02]|uniref:NAD-dependent epimerase/dehydratase family protein n=1 Tax=Sphingomonas sp. M1-B02 TaxID=3114300 RepID=UPI00223F3A93|nr:NAD(P)-dependent oxidoreductase [Sphingomonas sp. S6-11]UZK65053.1 NAD(P)-dependent oxidoreductase [Sphingomonas sp. S6-11]